MLVPASIIRNIEAITDSPSRDSAVKACCDATVTAYYAAR